MTSTDTHALKVISHSSRIVEHLRKNIYLYLFFILILLKLICFAGFSIDQLHLVPQLGKAFYMVFAEYVFRPIFYCCIVLGFLSFSFLFKGRGRGWFLVLVNLFFSWLLLVDIWYLRGFNAMPSLHLLQQGSNLDNLSGSIFPLIHWIDLLFVIDLPILFFLLLRKSKNLKSIEASTRHFVILFVSCLILIFSVMPLVRLWERIFHLDPISPIIDRWEPRITRHNLSPIGYHIVTAYSFFMENKTLKYSTEDLAGIKSWYAENREDLPNNRFAGIAEGMNLIVIQVESLEAFPLQHKINGQEVTPVLNGLLKHAFYFTNFYEQVGNGMSSDGDLMLNTSIYPVTEGATFFRYPFTTYNTFPKVLRKMGYFTSVYHPDNGSFWNWLPALSFMGFEQCVDASHYDLKESFNLGISDGSLLEQVGTMILKQKRPFYSFMVTLSGHSPFELPEDLRELKLGQEQNEHCLGKYFQVVHYTDKQIGKFIARLDNAGLLANTMIVIYGDHEGVHKYFPNEIGTFKPRESWFETNSNKLPLIIYNPKFLRNTIYTTGGQIDLFPTIAYLLGVDKKAYAETVMGRNLLNTRRSFALLYSGEVMGKNNDENWLDHTLKAPTIGDLIIRGNYYNLPGSQK